VTPRRRFLAGLGALALEAGGCRRRGQRDEERPPGPVRLVLQHQPFLGDPAPLQRLFAGFERDNPGVDLVAELLPSAPGAVHQYYLTALEGGSRDFDVFILDVIWVAEFARAGWIADLTAAFPPDLLRRDYLPGAASAVIVDGATFAVPWYIDVGVFYRRSDLVPRAPRTYGELVASAHEVTARRPGMRGYLWQALQSEALVCNVYEAIWGHGGASIRDGRVLLDTPEAREALGYLRTLVSARISPPSVTSMAEEESRRVFQAGDAVFMRNWPYAWAEAESPGSAIRGRVGLSTLPTLDGSPGRGALGGFQIALNAHTPAWKIDAAHRLIAHLTSPEANLAIALAYGRNPPRAAVYRDPRLLASAPAIAALLPIVERAEPRPVTPYYPMIDGTLAAEFSAAVTGVRSPAEALRRAQGEVDHLMRGAP
jgi:multiple sugar transport system substrate-binding protein